MSPEYTITREWRVANPPTGYAALRLVEAQIPPLGATDVLVKVHAVSLQYRDMLVAKGEYALAVKRSPVLGSDAAGSVVALGAEVVKWKLGDRVASNFNITHVQGDLTTATSHYFLGAPIDGVLTEYKVFPSDALVAIPEHLSWEEASTLPCAGVTAYEALMGGIRSKAAILFALQFAVASGAVSIVTTSSESKAAIARSLGAQHVINYNITSDWENEVLRLTGGEGVDHALEVSGSKTLAQAIACTRYGGTISAIGFVTGVEPATNVYMSCFMKALVLRGILVGPRVQFENMNRLIAARQIKPVVDTVFDFEQLVEALTYLESQKHVGKVVIRLS
ncbi:GroES-like protein [Auricularia subglabra TFB-10046 SS5]|nr:GroES-like protein [Auricularia subglabra TFB-10046 SS5]